MIRGLLDRAQRSGVAPAIQAVVCRGPDRMLDLALGQVSASRLTGPDTLFDLASLTKVLLTATAWTELWARGLDHPDQTMAPGLRVEDVLRHRAGFPAHRRFDANLGQIRPETWSAWRAILAQVRRVPRRHPGSTVYSDLGFMLLGERIEERSGRRLEAWATEEGFHAFDRRDGPRTVPKDLALAGQEGRVHDDNARAMGGVAGHAGLFGSARTVAAAAQRSLERHRVSTQWQAAWAQGTSRFGLGWDHPEPGGTAPGWPSRAVGHLGHTGTSVWIDPRSGLIAVLLTNRIRGNAGLRGILALRRAFHAAVWQVWGSP
ncbi:MAG: serine hydrolase domain-containing protein [Myxococcota bacterium]